MAELFNQDDLRELLQSGQGPRVSLFMPTHRSGPEVQQNPIRFKNLLGSAVDLLKQRSGHICPQLKENLDAARGLTHDQAFWQHQDQGLAMFLDEKRVRLHRVPLSLDEHVAVGEEFEVGRMLPVLRLHGLFYIVAASEQKVRLLRATSVSVSDVNAPELPSSLEDVAAKDVSGSGTHSERLSKGGQRGGAGPMVRHGYHHERNPEEDLLQYFRKVDEAVCRAIGDPKIPLVFAGVEEEFPAYKEVNSHPGLIGECIPGNPDEVSDEALRDAAWKLAAPEFDRAEEEISNQLSAAHTANRASCEPAEILEAARMGAVGTLLVAREHSPDRAELIEAATLETLRCGGEVVTVSSDVVKGDGLCALYRHPVPQVESMAP
jgi:hypothetical protein